MPESDDVLKEDKSAPRGIPLVIPWGIPEACHNLCVSVRSFMGTLIILFICKI